MGQRIQGYLHGDRYSDLQKLQAVKGVSIFKIVSEAVEKYIDTELPKAEKQDVQVPAAPEIVKRLAQNVQ